MHRKRAGLSQDEVAYLLGCGHGAKVSRYERFNREPSLRTALAYEVIFQVPVRELFAGIYEQSRRDVERRTRYLVRRIERHTKNPLIARKLVVLKAITDASVEDFHYEPSSRQ
jgi:transcriptional regulator with XRE-family HTH domain